MDKEKDFKGKTVKVDGKGDKIKGADPEWKVPGEADRNDPDFWESI